MSRKNLPFREKTEVFLYDKKGNVVAENHGHYIMFPGGGIDKGEDMKRSAGREIQEETGAVVSPKNLTYIGFIDAVWFPEWKKGNPKRQARYKEFQGERIHFMIGQVEKFGKPTSTEGNAFKGTPLMEIKKAIKLLEKQLPGTHPNFMDYQNQEIMILKTLQHFM